MVSLHGEYQYALNNPSMDVSACWSGFGSEQNNFTIPGMRLDRRFEWLGVRLDVAKSDRARLFLRGGIDVSF